jgi:HNH endonuclease/AP2 domain
MEITQELLHELFEYRDGELYWKVSRGNARIGMKAGHTANNGYIMVGINKKYYLLHRLIFLMLKGHLPKYLDHIDNNKINNRIENLRECSLKQNSRNCATNINKRSGLKGVSWNSKLQKWAVRIRTDEGRKFFGYYFDKELAALVAEEARNKYHGEFANHGNKNEVST